MSAFQAATARAWEQNVLLNVLLELTYRCNLDCFFCYNDLNQQGQPLSLTQYLRLFDDLQALGTLNLTLSGGEPLAHKDFFALGAAARARGFVIRVKSNGHALTGKLARRLQAEVDPFIIEISLHGATAATHDRQTRVLGSFAQLQRNLQELRALGLRVKLNAPVTRWNEGELPEMYALADTLGLRIEFDPQITLRDDGDSEPLSISPSAAGVARLHALHAARAATAAPAAPSAPTVSKHCGAGSAVVAVDPYGNVYPCVQWRRRVGNLHQQSIRDIWLGPDSGLGEIRAQNQAVKQMLAQLGQPTLAFCPGSAEQQTGSPTQLYPAARLALQVRQLASSQASHPHPDA